jgi:hypothetical protein
MKNVFLLMVVSALLVTLGFAQTPDAGSNTSVANVSGCLGGSDGAYTVTEDGTHQVFKITTSRVDLKPHVGHDVKLTGQNASAATSSGAGHSLAVTELSMISEHCAAAAAAPVATIIPPSETVIAPDASATVPAVTATAPTVDAAAPATPVAAAPAPAAPVASTPAVEAAAPATPVSPPAATVVTPVVEAEAVAPVATATPSSAPDSSPAVEATPAPRPSAHARKHAAAQAAAATAQDTVVSPSPEPAGPPAADTPTAASAVSAPDAAVPDTMTPAPKEAHRASSLPLLIGFVVLIIVLGTTVPLIGRWRKRKMLERDGSPNLSFTNEESADEVITKEAISDEDKRGPRKVA